VLAERPREVQALELPPPQAVPVVVPKALALELRPEAVAAVDWAPRCGVVQGPAR
jgi:hypothetical protein